MLPDMLPKIIVMYQQYFGIEDPQETKQPSEEEDKQPSQVDKQQASNRSGDKKHTGEQPREDDLPYCLGMFLLSLNSNEDLPFLFQ